MMVNAQSTVSPQRQSGGKIRNIIVNALRMDYLRVMLHKVYLRLTEMKHKKDHALNLEWISSRKEDVDAWGRGINEGLWEEALKFADSLKRRSEEVLSGIPHDLGGGGHYAFLYFIARHKKPNVILESGVAAGFSSSAFLEAMKDNGKGKLFSSDFPYFRLENPEKFVGVLVKEELKEKWELHIKGDRENLRQILAKKPEIDIVFYDSDKSYDGRQFFTDKVLPYMKKGGVMIMDDIQDNTFFKDHVEKNRLKYHVFEFEKKYFGLIE